MTRRHGTHLIAAMLIGATLAACGGTSIPTGLPTLGATSTPSATPTPSESPTPTATATATPSSEPSPSEDAPSNPPPKQVVGLTASTGGGSMEVVLRWTQNSEADVVSYIVLRASSPGGSPTQIGTVSRQEVADFGFSPFVDSQASVGYYRVRAVDSDGQKGPKSAEVCGAAVGSSC